MTENHQNAPIDVGGMRADPDQPLSGLWDWDIAHGGLEWSPEIYRLFGVEPNAFGATYPAFLERVHPDDRDKVSAAVRAALEDGQPYQVDHRILTRSGDIRSVREMGKVERDAAGKPIRMLGIVQDMGGRLKDEVRMGLLAQGVEQSADLIVISNTQGVIEYVNPAFCRASGYAADEAIGASTRLLKSGLQEAAFYRRLWETLASGEPFHDVLVNRRKDGSVFFEDKTITPVRLPPDGPVTHFVSTGKDITDQLQSEERIRHLSEFSPLTNLPNRAAFMKMIDDEARRLAYVGGRLAIAHVDVDRFKAINEAFGVIAADQLLKAIGERLQQAFPAARIAHLGADEFGVLWVDIAGIDALITEADHIMAQFAEDFSVAGHAVFVTASVGLSLYPDDASHAADLLRTAASAMYEAKNQGGACWRTFIASPVKDQTERLDMERELRQALAKQEFTLYYQPQASLQTGRIVGLEALLRWRNPQRGMVSPGQFIPMLEQTGLIEAVGEWVLASACEHLATWLAAGLPAVRVSVNVSPRQFRSTRLPQVVARTLAGVSRAPGAEIELEITESALLHDTEVAVATLRTLRQLGARIAIDDFGTGYSCLSYLKDLPVDTLKLAQPFVQGIPEHPRDRGIAALVIGLGKNLNMDIVAEGVETEEQLAVLREEGCTLLQGYLFSRPIPAEDVPLILASGKTL